VRVIPQKTRAAFQVRSAWQSIPARPLLCGFWFTWRKDDPLGQDRVHPNAPSAIISICARKKIDEYVHGWLRRPMPSGSSTLHK
jgi:hypothetical protein